MDVPQSQAHHAQHHEQRHQADSQRNRCPLEAIFIVFVGHGRGDGSEEIAPRSGEASGAGASRRRLARPASSSANTSVEAGSKGTLIQNPVAVPPAVACRTDAGVVVDSVLAGASVKAGVSGTFVDVDFAALAGEPRAAAAHARATVEHTEPT